MSPQMNGEPRDGMLSTPDLPNPPIGTALEEDRALPRLQAVNAAGLSKTTIRDEVPLAPLFTQESATDLRARWDTVQKGFVDDPGKAVHAADDLVAHVTQSLAESFAKQRAELEKSLDQAGAASTENLRIALRQYRSFFERLLTI
jgi:hypothetical protein